MKQEASKTIHGTFSHEVLWRPKMWVGFEFLYMWAHTDTEIYVYTYVYIYVYMYVTTRYNWLDSVFSKGIL